MSFIKVLHCRLCLKNGNIGLSTKSVLLKIGDGTLSQQLARISTTHTWKAKLPIATTTQIQTSASIKSKKDKDKQDNRMWKEIPSIDRRNNILQYSMMLSKFRLTSLVVMTSMAGYALAPAPFNLTTFALCAAGTGLVSAAANSINQYHEVPFDAQMSRTKNRVLVKGLLEPTHAISFAALSSAAGLGVLYVGVNPLTAALGAANLFLYTSVYTPMKRMSILNTWLGSVALCRRVALRHTGVITAACAAAPYLGLTNMWFALEALPLNLYFTYLAWQFYKKSDSGSSRKLFRFSLIHLPALMLLMLVNKKYWSSADAQEEAAQDVKEHKLADKRITVLPRGPVVAAQDAK